jgi:hypothetical protein
MPLPFPVALCVGKERELPWLKRKESIKEENGLCLLIK